MNMEQFYKSYRGRGNLYIVWNGSECLYVGISTRNVWNRWFYGSGPHMFKNIGGHWRGDRSSPIGRHVIDNMPESWGWTIEIRTIPEHELRDEENRLIRRYTPPYNTAY